MENKEVRRPWPDPDKPGNRLVSTYILGGLDIIGSIELRNCSENEKIQNTDMSGCSQTSKK